MYQGDEIQAAIATKLNLAQSIISDVVNPVKLWGTTTPCQGARTPRAQTAGTVDAVRARLRRKF